MPSISLKRVLPALALAVLLTGCASSHTGQPGDQRTLPAGRETPAAQGSPSPSQGQQPVGGPVPLPEKLQMGADGLPMLAVYVKSASQIEEMPLEKYLQGVLAGEMKNDWPLEALKAQAILARTFVLKFLEEKESRYPNADISTDIEEAQAYDLAGVNDRVRQAVTETQGQVLISDDGEFPFAWFHAHSGGITALAKEGLEYENAEPPYTQSVKGMESDQAPAEAAKWQAVFSAAEVMKAAARLGARGERLSSIQVGQRGESGRATTLVINGSAVPAASFRIALGSTKMKSTLLDKVGLENNQVTISGRGYGHGVGMSQWGAYGLAQQGKKANEIAQYYFRGVRIERLW
ncbi:MAG: SpoIID/LytB domain-containing protein [Oscillospiraceae bacterium]|jgi:stage II sporulation protein D|nr:SpoIID/LytB domain-containing protein [Oscillospiraceae bacterium]